MSTDNTRDHLTVALNEIKPDDFLESHPTEVKSCTIVFPSVHTLTYAEIHAVLQACAGIPNLKKLKLQFLQGADIPLATIGYALTKAHYLTTFHLDCDKFRCDNINNLREHLLCFTESLNSHSRIKDCRISFTHFLEEESIILNSIISAMSAITTLETLWIYMKARHAGCSSCVTAKSCELMCRFPNLKVLKLGGVKLSEVHVKCMSSALQTNRRLRELSMWNCGVNDRSAVALANVLKVNSSLEKLDVSWNDISEVGFVAFAEALETNTTLQGLYLHQRRDIGECSYQALERMLQRNFVLKDIWTRVENEKAHDMISFYLNLNKTGKRNILRNDNASHDDWVATLASYKSDLSGLFYYVSKNPVLVERCAIDVKREEENNSRELGARCA